MPPPIRLLVLGPTHWLHTQSVYHAVAEAMTADAPDTILLAQPLEPYVCLGYHQELAAVLDRAACEAMRLPIVRRRVGGGATYLDVNQLFYQCVFHHTRVPAMVNDVYARLLAGPVATLKRLGLAAKLFGENEIEVGGKRIAGIGGGRIGESAVVVGNLLFDFDYHAMARAWRVPSEAFRRLAAEALSERLTTLWAELSQPISPDAVQSMLIEEFARALGRPLERGRLTRDELQRLGEIEQRLTSNDWLGLHPNGGRPMTALKIAREVFIRYGELELNEGRVRAALRVRAEIVEAAVLEGLPGRDWDGLAAQLIGLRATDWRSALASAMTTVEPLPTGTRG